MIGPRNQNTSFYCSPDRWIREATQEAVEAGLKPGLLLAGRRGGGYHQARWRVWHRLSEAGYSYASIARACGADHTSVRYGHLRLRGEMSVNTYRKKAVASIEAAE
jgi:hypothetical protein